MKGRTEAILRALLAGEGLKSVKRKGWAVKAGVRKPESVAEHSYCVALAAMLVADASGLDCARAVKTALLHDLCEAVTGDIQPGEMPVEAKHALERKALKSVLSGLGPALEKDYLALFDDFNGRRTPEAVAVGELDKLEMAAQALAYERGGRDLDEFWRTAEGSAATELSRELLGRLRLMRRRRP
ncbi:MAG: HD domain-containing protein [Nitrososphaerota archaeon]|nr:HD domain-containing protein [Nitrososphaerota archaeon]MDG6939594.1 HD domain-containing protein [Nitrososphaerota archaeon]